MFLRKRARRLWLRLRGSRDHAHDADLVLLEVGDKKDFEAAHIAGAQFISLQDISTPEGSGLDLEIPATSVLQETFEKRGNFQFVADRCVLRKNFRVAGDSRNFHA